MEFNSNIHEVVTIKRKSKARYAIGIKVGDKIKFSIKGFGERGSRGLHATVVVIFVNGEALSEITQGELDNFYDIFELKEDKGKLSENEKGKLKYLQLFHGLTWDSGWISTDSTYDISKEAERLSGFNSFGEEVY